jgi:ankyrin repeat protein
MVSLGKLDKYVLQDDSENILSLIEIGLVLQNDLDTALICAVRRGNISMVKLLLSEGAEPSYMGYRCIKIAKLKAYDKIEQLIRWFLSDNLDQYPPLSFTQVENVTHVIHSSNDLVSAARTGNVEQVKSLLEENSKIDSIDLAVAEAARNCYFDVVRIILESSHFLDEYLG